MKTPIGSNDRPVPCSCGAMQAPELGHDVPDGLLAGMPHQQLAFNRAYPLADIRAAEQCAAGRLGSYQTVNSKIFGRAVVTLLNNHTERPRSLEYYENLSGLIFSADSADSLSLLCPIAWHSPPFARWLDNAEPPYGEHEYQPIDRGKSHSAEGRSIANG